MPQIDLTTLNPPQLRSLLDSARARGQARLAYEILQEMAARRDRRPADPSESRVVAFDLGDPAERHDGFAEPAPATAAADDEPALILAPAGGHGRRSPRRRKAASPPPLALEPAGDAWEDDIPPPEPDPEDRPLRLEPAEPVRPTPPPYRPRPKAGFGFFVGIAAGVAAGVVLGWGLGETAHDAFAAPAVAAPIQTAALAPPPAPVAAPVAPAEPPPEPAGEPLNALPPADAAEAPPAPVEVAEASHEDAAPATEPAAKAETVKTSAATGACATEPTAADRTICAAPQLQRLQRELREAYADALDAHEDRALLRQHQLEWREARNGVAEPEKLARLYEQRIRKLNAAAAAAREGR